MSIKTIDPCLSQEYALKPKKKPKKVNVARYILKELCDLQEIPERTTEKSEMKKKVSDLKKKKLHYDIDILRRAEEKKLRSEVLPIQTKPAENKDLLIDPLSFLNNEGALLAPIVPETLQKAVNAETYNSHKESVTPPIKNQEPTQPCSKYPFERIEENYKQRPKLCRNSNFKHSEYNQRSFESKQDFSKVKYEWEYYSDARNNNDGKYHGRSASNDRCYNKPNPRQNSNSKENFRFDSKSSAYSNYNKKYSNANCDSKIDSRKRKDSWFSKADNKFSCSTRHKRHYEHEEKYEDRWSIKPDSKFDGLDKSPNYSEKRHNNNFKAQEDLKKFESVKDSNHQFKDFIDLTSKKDANEKLKTGHQKNNDSPYSEIKIEAQKLSKASDPSLKAKSEILNAFLMNNKCSEQPKDADQNSSCDSCADSQDSQFTFNPESYSSKSYLLQLTESEENKGDEEYSQIVCDSLPLKRISEAASNELEKKRKVAEKCFDKQDCKEVKNNLYVDRNKGFSAGNKFKNHERGRRSDNKRNGSNSKYSNGHQMKGDYYKYHEQGEFSSNECSWSENREKEVTRKNLCVSYKY